MIDNNKSKQVANQRILYVHYGDNWLRGSEIVLLNLLKSAKENHYAPLLWCNSEILANQATDLGIEVIIDDFVCLGYWTAPKWNFVQFFHLLKKAKKIINEYQVSLVHCNNGAPCQWMVPVCKYSATPTLLHLHARYMYRDRLTLLFHGADRIIGVSRSVTELFKPNEFTTQRVSTIYNGIDPQRVFSSSPRDIRTELFAKKSDFVILYVGSLIPRKSVHQLLYALNKLKSDYHIKLAIVGSGSEQAKLTQLVIESGLSEKVKFFADNENIAELYSCNIDCFISVPTEEVFGLTLAEASLAKIPVITSNIPGINEIYTDKSNALLVSPGDTNELVSAIVSLIENPFLRNKLAVNAHKHITDTFSIKQQFHAFNDAYQHLLAKELKQRFLRVVISSIAQQGKRVITALFSKCYKRLLLSFSWEKSL